jgi:homoserine dehydrogenase
MRKIKIALLGLGNVGKGVWQILNKNKNEIRKRSGYDIEIEKILVRDINKNRDIQVSRNLLTDNVEDIFSNDDIKIVVELMGGAEPALEYMLRAMRYKKHVVTANKLVLATFGEQLFKTAEEEQVMFYYEASVGGGIPIIREINESLTANKIEQITGIVNGTTNYILTKMTLEGMDFESALKEAQEKGFAEADPTSDIEGHDVTYKLAIMASLAFGTKVKVDKIQREGICNIKKIDIEYAKKFGYSIKLLAIGKDVDNKLELRVHPTMIPQTHPLANVNDSFNAIFIKGNAVGDLMLYGRGAGDLPTGSAVVGDIISILRNNIDQSTIMEMKNNTILKEIQPMEDNKSEYYIRLNVKDRIGVLGQITTIFGEYNVSILTVIQEVKEENEVSLLFITHRAKEGEISKAISKIEILETVNKVEGMIRIERFKN